MSSRVSVRLPSSILIRTLAVYCGLVTGFAHTSRAIASDTLDVVDYGGRNHQILLDANKEAFVVGASSGQLYVYNGKNAIAPSASQVFQSEVAALDDVNVVGNKITQKSTGKVLGEILQDQTKTGKTISVLGYQNGSTQGYLDIDANENSRASTLTSPKVDSRIQRIGELFFIKTYKLLQGKFDWNSSSNIGVSEYKRQLLASQNLRKFSFTVPANGNYQLFLHGFKSTQNDLNLRLIELSTGRILGSSFSDLSSELITAELKANKKYGVVVSRVDTSKPVNYTLRLKAVVDRPYKMQDLYNGRPYYSLSSQGSHQTVVINGTIRPVTPFEYVSHFANIENAQGDLNAGHFQPDAVPPYGGYPWESGIFSFVQYGQALGSMIPAYNIADQKTFLFYSVPEMFHYSVTASGGNLSFEATNVVNYSDYIGYVSWIGSGATDFFLQHLGGSNLIGVRVQDSKNLGASPANLSVSTDAIEYEVRIEPTAPYPADTDGDGVPDVDDAFPANPNEYTDADHDAVGDNSDNCPMFSNPNQLDSDFDGAGNVCDDDDDNDTLTDEFELSIGSFPLSPDTDGDGAPDYNDNCILNYNPEQIDTDGDGYGDVCSA